MILTLRRELSVLFGGGCMVKTSSNDKAMFVTDAPRHLTAQELCDAEASLLEKGFLCSNAGNDLWNVDPDEARWQAMMADAKIVKDCPFPDEDCLHELYSVARMLEAHPSPWPLQPREPFRAILKRYHRPTELLRYAPILHQQCAVLLREHRALPSALAGLLFCWIIRNEGGNRT